MYGGISVVSLFRRQRNNRFCRLPLIVIFRNTMYNENRKKREKCVSKASRHKIRKAAALLLWAVILLSGKTEYAVQAKQECYSTALFGDVEVIKQEEKGYLIQVTVENSGEDFTGTVQVVFVGSNCVNTAYNKEIVLPARGKKQFTVSVPDAAVDTVSGICTLNFLDKRGNVQQSVGLKDIFGGAVEELTVGVLSENYAGLDFMEADGEYIDFRNRFYPLKLVELNADTLKEQLDGLYFLIIDRFDVSSLSREDIEAVQNWVKNGGWLMIGTGKYAEQTLSGFDQDFIDARVFGVSEPGEENDLSDNALNGYYDYYHKRDEEYYGHFTDEGIDFTNMAVADLDYDHSYRRIFFESSENPVMYGEMGDGSIMIFYFSLEEKELRKLSSNTVLSLYETLISRSVSYRYDVYSKWDSANAIAFPFVRGVDRSEYDIRPEMTTGMYILLAGAILCLIILRGKREKWNRVQPAAFGFLLIVGVCIFVWDARVKNTAVYSVTAQRVDGDRKSAYFQVCHSGVKPWTVELSGDYEMAGPGFPGWDKEDCSSEDYKYIVNSEKKGLSAGIKPEKDSESGFFYAEGRAEKRGIITCGDLEYIRRGKMKGTVTNETDWDMAYMAVWFEDNVIVFSDLKAGETIDLDGESGNAKRVYEDTTEDGADRLIYRMVNSYGFDPNIGYKQADMAALLVGMSIADKARPAGTEWAVIIGVAENYDRVTAGRYGGLSYGCLYTYTEMKGGGQKKSSGFNPYAFA